MPWAALGYRKRSTAFGVLVEQFQSTATVGSVLLQVGRIVLYLGLLFTIILARNLFCHHRDIQHPSTTGIPGTTQQQCSFTSSCTTQEHTALVYARRSITCPYY